MEKMVPTKPPVATGRVYFLVRSQSKAFAAAAVAATAAAAAALWRHYHPPAAMASPRLYIGGAAITCWDMDAATGKVPLYNL